MDFFFIIRDCLSSLSVWNFGTVWFIPFSEGFLNHPAYGCMDKTCLTEKETACFSTDSFFVKNWFRCMCLWQPGHERWRHIANHVTFSFPLNLEHGSPPRRIQNWSLTFSLVPSLAWSHFLSIWFLAPYATFPFPACGQQGVALLSPS